ncbi:transglutaminase domain-containing protein [Muriicola jejuensis]|uniref:transglutaminase domain-containing protein n=1 Tax=Muriicola jejuensis TaxID=504488 RepID=UPI001EF8CA84|nr:transglutaminase domain-containing protein [Muriicola jejuensis]
MKYSSEYPNAHSVRLIQDIQLTIKVVKGELDITQEILEEDLFLDESATLKSKRSLSFSSFFDIDEIEASSFISRNGKIEELKVEEFKEKDELDDSFYDDSRSINFVFPALEKGTKTRLKYIRKINNPRFLTPFYFGNIFPTITSRFTVIADNEVDLVFNDFNTENTAIDFHKKEGRKTTTYIWEVRNLDEFEFEDNAPNYRTVVPHILPVIKSYKSGGEIRPLLGQVQDLYNWYYSLIENINNDPPEEELQLLVDSITNAQSTEFEKVKALYYWTQENIKYVAFEYALGGFIPRDANEVFVKKYGDCKDNSSILNKMLQLAGIESYLTWIGTREIPYSYSEMPTPLVDNHMILSYIINDSTYFLDATGRYNPIEFPSSFIQGKEALIGLSKDRYKIATVPVVDAEKNSFQDQTVLHINDGTIIGNTQVKMAGYVKMDYLYDLEKVKSKDKSIEYHNSKFTKGNNSFLITDLYAESADPYDEFQDLTYEFKISNYTKTLGNELYINLNLNKKALEFKSEEDRKNPVEYEYKHFYEYSTILEVPEGYYVEYLPEDIEVKSDLFSASVQYEKNENTLKYYHKIRLNSLVVDLEGQKAINSLIEKVEQAYMEVVVLSKI